MRALVTGAAGFIGSHLCERLLDDGHEVVAVDKLTHYYDPLLKVANSAGYSARPGVTSLREDVRSTAVLAELPRVDTVFQLAAQPGVRPSWDEFPTYLRENVEAVHSLLEAMRGLDDPPRLVLASSSSVYGDAQAYPCSEGDATSPMSPYGVSKLSMERLAAAYVAAYQLPVVSLRYFTVYGPRQRPDMAFNRFIRSAISGRPLELYGNGEQVRQFTYVDDVVEATLRAGQRDLPAGLTLNVCGGESTSVNGVLALLSELMGEAVRVVRFAPSTGDVRRTGGSPALARRHLAWMPTTTLRDGLQRQLEWHRTQEVGADAAAVESV